MLSVNTDTPAAVRPEHRREFGSSLPPRNSLSAARDGLVTESIMASADSAASDWQAGFTLPATTSGWLFGPGGGAASKGLDPAPAPRSAGSEVLGGKGNAMRDPLKQRGYAPSDPRGHAPSDPSGRGYAPSDPSERGYAPSDPVEDSEVEGRAPPSLSVAAHLLSEGQWTAREASSRQQPLAAQRLTVF